MIASPRRRFIICLDTALLIIFILLLSPRLTGLPLHEVLGVIFFIPIVIHLLIAWPWIQNATRKFFKTVSNRTRFNFFLNAILFILVITELLSGFVISQVALPGLGIKTINDRSWRSVHNLPLNFVVFFTGLHIAVNWGWIVAAFKKRLSVPKQSSEIFSIKLQSILVRIGILILATGLISIVLYSIIGEPSFRRLYNQNEITRFYPTLGHGIVQFLGEAFLLAIVAFIARKWLRIRL
ncbi:MAG TPA: DUF4405 domain-containing protein [Chitinophagaceae bacterium]|jgi:hypothetical protein|nr:DUF4405 domain-containing protein [Chitinophagaceae bacterium]